MRVSHGNELEQHLDPDHLALRRMSFARLSEQVDQDVDAGAEADRVPIIVDMDDTLLRTDTLHESVLSLAMQQPWCLLLLPLWLLGGRAHLKRMISDRVTLQAATLPINAGLHAWLQRKREEGRVLHLVSAADQRIVSAVAAHVGLFDSARGSDGVTNLSGARKLAAIEAEVGPRFTYAGDSPKDLPVWEKCGSAILVGDVASLQASLAPGITVVERFATPPVSRLKLWRRALRLHQWAKNILLFVATLLGGDILNELPMAVAGFVAFGLLASATYLLNDMLDLPHDRLHRSKRLRPFASGDLPVRQGIMAIAALAAGVCLILPFMPMTFALVAGLYLVVTIAYSARIKRVLMLDVFTLAGLFTIRIGAGTAAVDHPLSPWLMAFSMFFFLSLACVKRYSECLVMIEEGRTSMPGRAYRPADLPWLIAMGSGAGFSAMSTFFLFLVETGSPILSYPRPRWLWFACIILGWWICRTWALAARGQMDDDPVLFAVKDRLSLLMAGVIAILVLLARS